MYLIESGCSNGCSSSSMLDSDRRGAMRTPATVAATPDTVAATATARPPDPPVPAAAAAARGEPETGRDSKEDESDKRGTELPIRTAAEGEEFEETLELILL